MPGCRMTLSHAAHLLGGTLIGSDAEFNGVVSDSRKIEADQLFVALIGPNFDAHAFLSDAKKAYAAGVLVSRQCDIDLPQIVVDDTLKSLAKLAAAWRASLNIPVIGVTGSNGKTTVKEMTASILNVRGKTFSTKGNLNNEIGVPLSLLSIDESHEAAVIEMGANHPGEIAYLTKLARPTVALITNAAAAHLEGFGSIEGVAHAKGEIYQGMLSSGIAIINADDNFAPLWRQIASHYRIMTFGVEKEADVSCSWSSVLLGNQLTISTPNGKIECFLKLLGKHNVMNALTSTCAALATGIELEEIKKGLENVQPVSGRLETNNGYNGSYLINDTYNANPNSLLAAIDVLISCSGEKILVLGDMGELGEHAEQFHANCGKIAKEQGVDKLFVLGELSKLAAQAFGEHAFHFDSQQDLISELKKHLNNDVNVLIKGSRMMAMEKVVDALTDRSD